MMSGAAAELWATHRPRSVPRRAPPRYAARPERSGLANKKADALEAVASTFTQRVQEDLTRLQALRSPTKLGRSYQTSGSSSARCFATAARGDEVEPEGPTTLAGRLQEAEELAGAVGELQRMSREAGERCQRVLGRLPLPETFASEFDATRRGPRELQTVLAPILAHSTFSELPLAVSDVLALGTQRDADPAGGTRRNPAIIQRLVELRGLGADLARCHARSGDHASHSGGSSSSSSGSRHMAFVDCEASRRKPPTGEAGFHRLDFDTGRANGAPHLMGMWPIGHPGTLQQGAVATTHNVPTAASLREGLRKRMAVRLQCAWRRLRTLRALRASALRAIACRRFASWCAARAGALTQRSLTALRAAAAARRSSAATVIASFWRGARARRRAARARRLMARAAERAAALQCQATAWHLRAWRARAATVRRWRLRPAPTIAVRPPPMGNFWALFPLEGKTAVSKALRGWALQRMTFVLWVARMGNSA